MGKYLVYLVRLLKSHFKFWNCLIYLNKHLIFVGSLKEPLSVDNRAILKYAQARRICPPKSQINIWNRLTFLNQHLIFSRNFGRTFEWKFCENFWQPGIKSHRFEIQLLCVLISKNVKCHRSFVISRKRQSLYIVSARFSVISELEPGKKIIHISISKWTMLS